MVSCGFRSAAYFSAAYHCGFHRMRRDVMKSNRMDISEDLLFVFCFAFMMWWLLGMMSDRGVYWMERRDFAG